MLIKTNKVKEVIKMKTNLQHTITNCLLFFISVELGLLIYLLYFIVSHIENINDIINTLLG